MSKEEVFIKNVEDEISIHEEKKDEETHEKFYYERGNGAERRRRRKFIPFIYFVLEIVALWLFIGLIHLTLDISKWVIVALILYLVMAVYRIKKTFEVYKRQRNYPPA